MGLQALKIVEKEFADAREVLDETNASDQLKSFFESIKKHILWRIEKECIEQDEPDSHVAEMMADPPDGGIIL